MIVKFLIAGQSNATEFFTDRAGDALAIFRQRVIANHPEITDVVFVDGGLTGSAILKRSAKTNAAARNEPGSETYLLRASEYWYDETARNEGPVLADVIARVADSADGIPFSGIIWAQGEADTAGLGADFAARYREGLDYTLEVLRQAAGTQSIYIQGLGDRAFYNEALHGASPVIRGIQAELAARDPDIHLLTTIHDLPLRDTVHLTPEGYETAAARMADAISGTGAPLMPSHAALLPEGLLLQFDLEPGERFLIPDGDARFKLDGGSGATPAAGFRDIGEGRLLVEMSSPEATKTLIHAAAADTVGLGTVDFIRVERAGLTLPLMPFALDLAGVQTGTLGRGGVVLRGTDTGERLQGFAGDDWIHGNAGGDWISGGAGTDRLFGGEGDDAFVFEQDGGLDVIYDFGAAEVIVTKFAAEDFAILAREGGSELRGTDGTRLVIRGVTPDALEGRIYSAESFRMPREGMGGALPEAVQGSAGNDWLYGGGGSDRLDGLAGTDRLFGGDGADMFVMSANGGTDIVYDFTLGLDRITLSGLRSDQVMVQSYGDTDTELRADDGTRLVIRSIPFTRGDPIPLTEAFWLHPQTAGDSLQDEPMQNITGTRGNDTLQGSNAAERIDGLDGTDRLNGGGGSDLFVFRERGGLDVVYDFVPGLDRIETGFGAGSYEIMSYRQTDTELRAEDGTRMVLRGVRPEELSENDFLILV